MEVRVKHLGLFIAVIGFIFSLFFLAQLSGSLNSLLSLTYSGGLGSSIVASVYNAMQGVISNIIYAAAFTLVMSFGAILIHYDNNEALALETTTKEK